MNVTFTPLKDFADKDLNSAYCIGLNYTLRPENEKLAAKVEEWLEAGLVRLGAADGSPASESRVKGTGTVI